MAAGGDRSAAYRGLVREQLRCASAPLRCGRGGGGGGGGGLLPPGAAGSLQPPLSPSRSPQPQPQPQPRAQAGSDAWLRRRGVSSALLHGVSGSHHSSSTSVLRAAGRAAS
jgi:hypothetical protein